jgi:thiol-disulfide isomerase/thioredoxin
VSPGRRSRKRVVVSACFAALVLTTSSAAAKPRIAGRDVLTGKRVALSQFAGQPVFVNVWGSWCYGCRADARTLSRFSRLHRNQVAFIGIDAVDTKKGARAYYERFDTEYPSIWDPRGTLAGAWSRGAPTTLVFDRRHIFVQRIEGSVSLAQLNAALRRVTRS